MSGHFYDTTICRRDSTFYLNVSSVAINRNIVYWNTIVIYSNSAANAIILLINFRGPNQKQVSRFVVNKMKPFSA